MKVAKLFFFSVKFIFASNQSDKKNTGTTQSAGEYSILRTILTNPPGSRSSQNFQSTAERSMLRSILTNPPVSRQAFYNSYAQGNNSFSSNRKETKSYQTKKSEDVNKKKYN